MYLVASAASSTLITFLICPRDGVSSPGTGATLTDAPGARLTHRARSYRPPVIEREQLVDDLLNSRLCSLEVNASRRPVLLCTFSWRLASRVVWVDSTKSVGVTAAPKWACSPAVPLRESCHAATYPAPVTETAWDVAEDHVHTGFRAGTKCGPKDQCSTAATENGQLILIWMTARLWLTDQGE